VRVGFCVGVVFDVVFFLGLGGGCVFGVVVCVVVF